MNGWSKKDVITIIKNDFTNIHNLKKEMNKELDFACDDIQEYFNSLIEQISHATSGPLIPKTPKVARKKDVKRIETIHENEVAQNASKRSNTIVEDSKMEEEEELVPVRTSRRAASQKASLNIKKQQSLSIISKMRRPASNDGEEIIPVQKPVRPSRTKRTKSAISSSDEEETKRPSKISKTKQIMEDVSVLKIPKIEPDDTFLTTVSSRPDEEPSAPESTKRGSRTKRTREDTSSTNSYKKASKQSHEPIAKKTNVINEIMDMPNNMDVTVESSLYEDAVGKSIPMNSTMNPNTTVTIERKMMNVTVVLEPIRKTAKNDETITIKKSKSGQSSSRNSTINEDVTLQNIVVDSPFVSKPVLKSRNNMKDRIKEIKEVMQNEEFDALITDDESSPERQEVIPAKKLKKDKKDNKTKKRLTRLSLVTDDDDVNEVIATPAKSVLRDVNAQKTIKNAYKTNQLFSPYAKDSVKKRVEAFEQAGLNSPKSVDVDTPPRLTRTKTRAMAAAEADANHRHSGRTVAQKAARKSLAKAKKISLLKQMKDNDDGKENNVISSAQKPSRLMAVNDKLIQKQQQRTTPVGKSRLQMPMSVNRVYHTPVNAQVSYQTKAATATKSIIVSGIESFLAPSKPLTKSNSNDNLAEKKRKANDEDARRKRDDALKALSEEKRRKREEKELKNKLAREAKEKLDMEKRLKLEREREEKAKAALLQQEKQREESEKKRLLQLQRAQEKEERRRQEEQLRQQRLQEQEEAERQLAEQKRREQEAERRKQAEARAQQLAAAEAHRMQAHYLAKAKMAAKNQPGPTTYKLDSEPDDDDASDDEAKPKHLIPYWAQANIRKTQLAIQEYVPFGAALQFFGAKRCTPDLTQLFTGIKKERLQRTSSAIWKPPPRYSMMAED